MDYVLWLEVGQWELVFSGVKKIIFVMYGIIDGNMWVVGVEGIILYNNGFSWGFFVFGIKLDFYGVFVVVKDDVWVVGVEGIFLCFDGDIWMFVEVFGVNGIIFCGIWGVGLDDIMVVVSFSFGYWYWDGIVWMQMVGVLFNVIWVVGQKGMIWYWDGIVWFVLDPDPKIFEDLFSVYVVSFMEVYVVGEQGCIFVYNGMEWVMMLSPTIRILCVVWVNGFSDVYVVGDGMMFFYYDGNEWVDQILLSKVSYYLFFVFWGDLQMGKGQVLGIFEFFMGLFFQVLQGQVSVDLKFMIGYYVVFDVKFGIVVYYNWIDIGIFIFFGVVFVWMIIMDGDVFSFDFLDFVNIEGIFGIGSGEIYLFEIQCGYKDDFMIDNYDNSDFVF